MKRFYFLLLLLLATCIHAFSQGGKEFWFVAPEVTNAHGDSPLYFRISAFSQAANVTISKPADATFTPVNLNIPANTLYTYQVTPNQAENKPSNTINNQGFRITSDVDITVYYEVANSNNPDKFVLKGFDALGTEFYVISQNLYQNHTYTPAAAEHVDIVATKDNTTISITPTAAITGHAAGSTFTVTLNRGQTYSLEATNRTASSSLAGTYVTSNNDIAITISDDSIENDFGNGINHWDLIGDQLIPVSVIGTEYIAIRTHNKNTSSQGKIIEIQKVFILAVEENTTVMFDGDPTKTVVLSKGQLYSTTIINPSIYIKADKPIYAYQITSLSEEMGSAILPQISYTGSRSVAFNRNLTNAFYIQLATQGGSRNDFTLVDNAGASVAIAIAWVAVPGTDGNGEENTWYAAAVDLSTIISTGTQYTLNNSTGLFHMGILDQNSVSMNFGYYSSFSSPLNLNNITVNNAFVYIDALGTGTLLPTDLEIYKPDEIILIDTTLSKSSFDCSNVGPMGMDVIFTDQYGRNITKPIQINVTDPLAPLINCISNQTITILPGETNYTVMGNFLDPIMIDNCQYTTATNNFNHSATLTNAILPIGTTTITWTITDLSGNISECSFDVNVDVADAMETQQLDAVSINQNTNNSHISIEGNNIQSVQIININGQIILTKDVNENKTEVSLSNQTGGVYIVQVVKSNGIFSKKVLIK